MTTEAATQQSNITGKRRKGCDGGSGGNNDGRLKTAAAAADWRWRWRWGRQRRIGDGGSGGGGSGFSGDGISKTTAAD